MIVSTKAVLIILLVAWFIYPVKGEVSHSDPTKVVSPSTTYIGQYNQYLPEVIEFLGVPYAKPPIDVLRWKAPDKSVSLPTETITQAFKPACYQDDYNVAWYQQVATYFGHDLQMRMPEVSEDCLYLNIWAPRLKSNDTKLKPVMVWIHGGSNKAGWSYEPNYLGYELAKRADVLVVSIAYRLGVFGFLAHPGLREQTHATNFALLDQIAALEWIQDNIRLFGGDNANVTIMGESAGAANIGYLMSIPETRGLFHQAISQSGGFQMMADHDIAKGEDFGNALSAHLDGADINKLRQLDDRVIWEAAKQVAPDYDYRALVDESLFTLPPAQAFAKFASVNLLIGSNKNEFYMYQDELVPQASFAMTIADENIKRELLQAFTRFDDNRLGQDWLDSFLYMACPSALMAKLVNNNGKRSWLYQFEQVRDGGDELMAYHGGEIPYVFNSHDHWLPTNSEDRALTDSMMAAWANFAHHGDPQSSQQTQQGVWPVFEADSHLLKVFGGGNPIQSAFAFSVCEKLMPDYLNN
jgi:para-nitrobenzyl esterase